METVCVGLRVDTRKSGGVYVSVSHGEPLGLELFALVVVLKEVNDGDAVTNAPILRAAILDELLSSRFEGSLIHMFGNRQYILERVKFSCEAAHEATL